MKIRDKKNHNRIIKIYKRIEMDTKVQNLK